MRVARNPDSILTTLSNEQRKNLRRHGRLRCELLNCGLGQVVDISASGMRVAHRGKLGLHVGDLLTCRLQVLHLEQSVQASVVRFRNTGLRSHEVGLEFVGLTPEISKGLLNIVRLAVDSLTATTPAP